MTEIHYSGIESARFGYNIHRGICTVVNPKMVSNYIINNNVDVLILRLPIEAQKQVFLLQRMGFPYIVADTLVYYYADLTAVEPESLRNNLEFVPFQPEHKLILESLVGEIFPGYSNHYASNPLFRRDIIEGYQEWACSFLGGDGSGKLGWLVKRDGKYIGFAACCINDTVAEGVLYGVHPQHSGGGVYGDIIRFTQAYFKNAGFPLMKVSTQVQNYAVQKVWVREKFILKESYLTVHINSLLSTSVLDRHEVHLAVTDSEIRAYGEVSGDYNLLHFDDEFAKQCGFEERIAHGLIANSIISKQYGVIYPGNGTLFLGFQYKFFKPLYPSGEYSVVFSIPSYDEDKGFYLAVAKIYDDDGCLCVLAYSDLFKKKM